VIKYTAIAKEYFMRQEIKNPRQQREKTGEKREWERP